MIVDTDPWISLSPSNYFQSFDQAAQAVVNFLLGQTPLDRWAIVRREAPSELTCQGGATNWMVIATAGSKFELIAGRPLPESLFLHETLVEIPAGTEAPSACSKGRVWTEIAAPAQLGTEQLSAAVCVQLVGSGGYCLGAVLGVDPRPQKATLATSLPLVELCGQLLSTLLVADLRIDEQTRLAERAEIEAATDALTGLYNRRGWERLLTAAGERRRWQPLPATIIAIDVDRLKTINDEQGHHAGDVWLRQAATAIRACVRRLDVAARVGGDEFVILAEDCDAAGATALCERLAVEFARAGVGCSVGSASCQCQGNLVELWQQADAAMYAVKRRRAAGECSN